MTSALSFDGVGLEQDGEWHLRDLTLTIGLGERLAIVGRSGAGKSLIARLAAGLAEPTEGRVTVFGGEWRGGERALRSRIGVSLPRGGLLSELTGAENIRFALNLDPTLQAGAIDERVEGVLHELGVHHCAHRRLDGVSRGERRRIDLARMIALDPDLVILDDMLSGLDEETAADLEARVLQWIERRHRSLLLMTTSQAQAERFGARTLWLSKGGVGPLQH